MRAPRLRDVDRAERETFLFEIGLLFFILLPAWPDSLRRTYLLFFDPVTQAQDEVCFGFRR